MLTLPATPADFTQSLNAFRARLAETKSTLPPPSPGWYPFNSFFGLEAGLELIRPLYAEFAAGIAGKSIADVGCGDGDLALLFASWGAQVDAIDYPPTNYNRMQGITAAANAMALPVSTRPLNLDDRFEFPGHYGFTLFLGLLYHLQNPYYALNQLAQHTGWCLLSTRIAQVTTPAGIQIAHEPVAYLASGMEIENDATNYWIFSRAGLLRILQRTRWAVRGIHHAGCLENSNPSDPAADERIFLLLQSRVAYPGLQAHPAEGWHDAKGQNYRWTAKRFTLKVVLPLEKPVQHFTLDLYIPEATLPTCTVAASIDGEPVGSTDYTEEGLQTFRANLPQTALHHPDLTLDFQVSSNLNYPGKDYGVCVPLREGGLIPFCAD